MKREQTKVKATKAWAELHEDGAVRVSTICMMSNGNHMVRVRIRGLADDRARTARIAELEAEVKRLKKLLQLRGCSSKISGVGNGAGNTARPLNKRTHRRRPHV